ncbi:MAG: alkaline phosphatase family protein [Clostridia bacterium]|nr:alkaline phosphatase family protein [Clostridia bacterium]
MNDVTKADCSDFIFSIFEFCDHVGHDTGFNLRNPDYTGAFADAEADAMQIIAAIEARETYETEDWLILITSDHGGYNSAHGAMSIQERMTFIASNVDLGYEF